MIELAAEGWGWTPADLADGMTTPQLFLALKKHRPKRPFDPERLRQRLTDLRLKKGLPPVRPRE